MRYVGQVIVSNWLAKLKEAKEKNPERVKTIQLYSGIVEVMSKTLTGANLSDVHPSPKSSDGNESRGSRRRKTTNTGRPKLKA
jgi:hypothetical protein